MNVATIIRDQVGPKALYMLGAKNLGATEDALSFKIMKNAKGINHIKITLNSMDTYDIDYGYVRAGKYTIKATDKDVYCDGLHASIENNTNLYTSL
jgi:hypothetical protein